MSLRKKKLIFVQSMLLLAAILLLYIFYYQGKITEKSDEQAKIVKEKIEKLGENAQARIQAVDSFSQAYFTPDEHEYLSQTIGTTAEGIEILEKIMQMRNENISSYQQQEPLNKLTLEDVRGMMKDPRYFDPKERDESFVRKVDDAFARLYR